jgi:hypothetical protein
MSRVSDLPVFSEESGQSINIKRGTYRYRIVQSIVDLGLSLLETPRGKESLVEVATAIINARNAEQPPAHHIYPDKDKLDRMPYWIERFLASMKANFPETRISEEVKGEAEAQRYEWQGTMSDYNPRLAGTLFLSKVLIDNMVYAHERPAHRDAYEFFKFQMGVSVAHVIVHFLTGFLTGKVRLNTPPPVTLEPWGEGEEEGEAGRYWEHILFGGVLEFWSTKGHPLKNRQSGTPYVFDNGNRDARGWLVDLEYIKKFNEQGKHLGLAGRVPSSLPLLLVIHLMTWEHEKADD